MQASEVKLLKSEMSSKKSPLRTTETPTSKAGLQSNKDKKSSDSINTKQNKFPNIGFGAYSDMDLNQLLLKPTKS